ncbi:MAG TPA: chloramphenicol acetyltransferase [Candidatus Anaerobutyricum avicola]|nr:chloramphenicol acetyltransferase [Candidatus Anaerobutyricum avicola]
MREVNPMDTNRAVSWQFYIDAPMPMVTIFKTLDITNLMRVKAAGYKLNMLLCFCIMQAARLVKEFFMLPVGKKMMEYDKIGVNVIVANEKGGINSCDIPMADKLEEFNQLYVQLTERVRRTCTDHEITDHMMIGTSSLVKYDIDGAVNMYSGIFNNPFLIWGKYREETGGVKLPISFQFHHVQMDGMEACAFLENVQKCIRTLEIKESKE